jgi:hypothetical protein
VVTLHHLAQAIGVSLVDLIKPDAEALRDRKSAEPEIRTARAADPASRICGFVQTPP